jgi:hypothetical protein
VALNTIKQTNKQANIKTYNFRIKSGISKDLMTIDAVPENISKI